ncbi:DUF7681 family protein [Bacterioplanoides sp.]|uniref:Acb2/Tad1 domain-containing protein n=1 Tax=Bacterioplanoides sp. TaxID=2066072 RepID=UPI003B5C3AD9
MTEQKLTEGQWRVGIRFNPSGNFDVERIKTKAAELIDLIDETGKDGRCTALAMNAFEDGAMWAVKSVTKVPR